MTVYGRRRRRALIGVVFALLVLTGAVAARDLLGALGRLPTGYGQSFSPLKGLTNELAVAWPQQGQAALVLGAGRPAASPDQESVPIASLAKVITAYLTLERYPLSGTQDGFMITVTPAEAEAVGEDAAEDQSDVAVEAGERLSERQLLEALLIPSGNNIAQILASAVAGSEARFVAEMNAQARALGMDHTTYTDPSGSDPSTVSTAADQLRVLRQAMRFSVFREIVSTASVTLPVAGTLTNSDRSSPRATPARRARTPRPAGAWPSSPTSRSTGAGGPWSAWSSGKGRETTHQRCSRPPATPPSNSSPPSPPPHAKTRAPLSPQVAYVEWAGPIATGSRSLAARRPSLDVQVIATGGDHMKQRRRLLGILVPIAVVLLVSACGSGAPAATSTGSGGANSTTASTQKAVRFAQCMRSNGVSTFPDPGASGQFTIDQIANGSSLDTTSPAFTHALSACKSLEPAGFTGGTRSSQQQSAALKFAQCIRANGVTDFPDPAPGQPIVDTNRIPSAATNAGKSILQAAMRKCSAYIAAAGAHP